MFEYHVAFISKCRRKVFYERIRRDPGEVFHQLAKQKERRIPKGHLMGDRVHMMIAIPSKCRMSQVAGYLKGKRNFVGQRFWLGGNFVSMIGRDEAVIRAYIRSQAQ